MLLGGHTRGSHPWCVSPLHDPPTLPHILPAPPGQEQVGLIADGNRKLDHVVLWCHLGAVTRWGRHLGISPDSTHAPGVQPLPTPLPGGLECDFSTVQKDGAAELQLQGEGHLGGLRGVWWGFGGPKGLMGVSGVLPWPASGRQGTLHCSAGGARPGLSTPTSPCWDPARGTRWALGHGVLGALGGGSNRPPTRVAGGPQVTMEHNLPLGRSWGHNGPPWPTQNRLNS